MTSPSRAPATFAVRLSGHLARDDATHAAVIRYNTSHVPALQCRATRTRQYGTDFTTGYVTPMLRYSLTTLGCKVNQYDARALATALEARGMTPTTERARPCEGADLVVVNTCCITRTAMRKSRQAIRRAVRDAPHAAVVVVGCYCDYDARLIGEILLAMCFRWRKVKPAPTIHFKMTQEHR